MKHHLLSIFTILVMALAFAPDLSAKDATVQGPAIEFTDTRHDFGNIKEDGGAVSHTFTFRNTGDAPLVIVTASASCGCTKAKFTPRPIQPGDTGEVIVSYSPLGNRGEFDKSVTVRTNIKGRKGKTALRVSGVVIPKSR